MDWSFLITNILRVEIKIISLILQTINPPQFKKNQIKAAKLSFFFSNKFLYQ
jgi:hypothetical protein